MEKLVFFFSVCGWLTSQNTFHILKKNSPTTYVSSKA